MSKLSFSKLFILLVLSLSYAISTNAQKITVQVHDFSQDTLLLAHYLGDLIRVDNAILINDSKQFVIENTHELEAGVYMLILPPKNNYVELLITETENQFDLEFSAETLSANMRFKNAPDNQTFQAYQQFMKNMHPKVDSLNALISQAQENGTSITEIEKELNILQRQVAHQQHTIIKEHPDFLTAAIIKSLRKLDMPTFEGTEQEVAEQEFFYQRKHFFDDFKKEKKLLKSKLLKDRVDYFLEYLIVLHPDSLIKDVDTILNIVKADEKAFEFYFRSFLQRYYDSNYSWMDNVFVHLVKNYTLKDKTPFLQEELVARIREDALLWGQTLIGDIAPDINNFLLNIEETIQLKEEEEVSKRFKLDGETRLYSIEKPYTVIAFWAPDCGHCKKAMPVLVDYYEKHQDSVEVFAVCHKNYDAFPACAETLKEYNAIKWINSVDPYLKYIKNYDVSTTPLIMVLDENKKIWFKKLDVNQLEEAIKQMAINKAQEGG